MQNTKALPWELIGWYHRSIGQTRGKPTLDPSLVKVSKFLSLILRHRPQAVGITLDPEGWASVAAIIDGAGRRGRLLSMGAIQEVVARDDKQRFTLSRDGIRIRANHGHSLPVDLGLAPSPPPEQLFHGTASPYLQSIRRQGLVKGKRRYVHLSQDKETAYRVGARHGLPIVLLVATGEMHRDGFRFFCSTNGIWLTERVPARYLIQAAPRPTGR